MFDVIFGLKVNMDKSEVIPIGGVVTMEDVYFGDGV